MKSCDPIVTRDGLMTTDVGTENLFQEFFGGRYTLDENMPRTAWVKECTRLLDHLERYVDANVITDNHHRRDIDLAFWSLRQALNEKVSRESSLVANLVWLILVLLGDRPRHGDRTRVNHPSHFSLRRFRTVWYSQSPKQKAELIYFEFACWRQDQDVPPELLAFLRTSHEKYQRRGKHAELFVDPPEPMEAF